MSRPKPPYRQSTSADHDSVLRVRDLRVDYDVGGAPIRAVNGINLDLGPGETLGLVGESGSGKSTAAMAILRLTSPPGRVVGGSVHVNGEDMLALPDRALRHKRWREVSLIPQGSMNSLNPVKNVLSQFADALRTHEGRMPRREVRRRVVDLLELVHLPARVCELFPHELSGGMKQRVCIALAIALRPALIIADEPTSALDVVVQRVVAQTLLEVKERLGSSMLLIGHDMAVQAQLVDRIAVMYGGDIVELAPVRDLLGDPRHPYTRHLIASIPSIAERKPLIVNRIETPDPRRSRPAPVLTEVTPGHLVASHEHDEIPVEG